jgi:Uma2 family endonuclease
VALAELVSIDEYLSTSYRPDRDWVEGQLIERKVGEYDHSNLQGALVMWLRNRQREWGIRVLPEQRLRVRTNRFRIPDVCVVSRDQPVEPVFTKPPLLCIEVLSKDDSLPGMQNRVDDYLDFGVPNVWLLDPVARRAYIGTREGFSPEEDVLRAVGSSIEIPLDALFAELD